MSYLCVKVVNGQVEDKDSMTPYQNYIWSYFKMMHSGLAKHVIQWEELAFDHYKGLTDDGRVIFYDKQSMSCSAMSVEDAEYKDEQLWLNEFSRRLCRMMAIRGIDQKKLAKLTGLSQGTLSGYCSGKRCPSSFHIRTISEVLKCDPDYLIIFSKSPY